MKALLAEIRSHVESALVAALGEELRGVDPLIKAAGDPKFGDYQCNVAMSLAKRLQLKPRDVAQKIVEALPAAMLELVETPEIAGPGFINLRLRDARLAERLSAIAPCTDEKADRLGMDAISAGERETVVVDYSSPNVAKQMHVGHLRSTIIGDTIARVIEFLGHNVVRQNHVGDWGTQFGIILEELYERGVIPRQLDGQGILRPEDRLPEDPEELEAIYRAGNAKMSDPSFAERARDAVGQLQRGEIAAKAAWSSIRHESMNGVIKLYERLNVRLTDRDTRGESFYNSLLAAVGKELRASRPQAKARGLRAICREDAGALCIFLENSDGTPAFKNQDGDPLPMIVQKSDGAFLYATTDLAALAYRINNESTQPIEFSTKDLRMALLEMTEIEGMQPTAALSGGLGAGRILYVVGSPQKLHFQMLFATVEALGWTMPKNRATPVRLEHVAFGSVLGEDRKMLRTRSGESVKLKALLDEAVERAKKMVQATEDDPERKRGFDPKKIEEIADKVGIAAVKYADLSQNRNTDYVFSWDKMLALQGNTAPYMLYAYARIRSIYRKGAATIDAAAAAVCPIVLAEPAERALGLAILRMAETIESIAENLLPNVLCEYLYDLAGRFMKFYETCPVLKAPDDATRGSRLRLCDLTARSLRIGLDLLGIKTLEEM